MALKEYYWEFEQATPSTTWDIDNVPEGAVRASITEVFAEGGEIIQPDSQLVSPDGLQLSFGVQPKSGVALGKYYKDVPDSDQAVMDDNGNVVNITIEQNGGSTPSGNTF